MPGHRLAVLDDVKLMPIPAMRAEDRALVVLEGDRQVPFPIRRVFNVHAERAGLVGGKHAHRICQQFLVCVHGACEVMVCAELHERRTYTLDRPDLGLWIPASLWSDQRYLTADTVLMVLCDQVYDATDYLRDPEEYTRYRRSGSALA